MAGIGEWEQRMGNELIAVEVKTDEPFFKSISQAAGYSVLEKLALFLKDIASAWRQASQKQRNRLASCLFEAVLIKEKKVVAVVPTSE